ncbi:MAG: hypothetical protein WC254_06005 [Candidatus Woesearchaeota archaeon]|jgi:hypothetical protein
MTNKFFQSLSAVCLGLSLITIIGVFFAVYVYAVEEGYEKKELNINLVPPEVFEYTSIYSINEYYAQQKYNTAVEGSLALESSQSRYKNQIRSLLTVYNLDYLSTYNEIYEAWLVDQDTGYQLSQGLFTVDLDGYTTYSFNSNHYVNPYDLFVVTKEPYPDNDPRPSGDVVLVGYFDAGSLNP